MKTIPLYVESENGHDTFNVPQNQLQGAVENQLKDDKWVTIERNGGSTELLTAKDIPKDEPIKESNDEWKNSFVSDKPKTESAVKTSAQSPNKQWVKKFEKVRSATATQKAKGG